MIALRLVIILALTGIGISLFLFLLRQDRRYLRLAWQILKFSAALMLIFAALIMMGRIVLFRMPL
ncbi:MAG: hypothetical protein Q8O38_12900 [Sulfurimicrobium sp.]|nr:hypothetical protein [Sulfurimicrobium sp.]